MRPKSSTSKKIWTLFSKLYHFLIQNGLCSSLKTMVLEKYAPTIFILFMSQSKCQARVSAPREMDIHFLLLEEKQYSKKKATM